MQLDAKSITLVKYLIFKPKNALKDIHNYLSSFNDRLTERSLRYDIENINIFFLANKMNIQITKEAETLELTMRNGGPLKGRAKDEFTAFLDNIPEEKYSLSRQERQDLLFFIYLTGLPFTLDEITDALKVSKSTVKQALTDVREAFAQYNINLKGLTKSGMKLTGEEEVIRTALAHFIYPHLTIKLTEQGRSLSLTNGNPYLKNYILKALNKNHNKQKAELLFKHMGSLLPPIQNDEIYTLAIINIFIVFLRTDISCYADELDILNEEGIALTEEISALCNQNLGIVLPPKEFVNFTIYLNKGFWNDDSLRRKQIGSLLCVQVLIKEMVAEFADASYNYIIINNIAEDALGMLTNHFYAAVERVRKGIYIKNPFLDEIKQNYSDTFRHIRVRIKELENYLNRRFSDDDIGYFTLLAENMLDQVKMASPVLKNVILICGMGYGTSQILKQKLESVFDVTILDVVPHKTAEAPKAGILYISTVHDKSKHAANYVEVSPLLSSTDIDKLRKAGLKDRVVDINKLMTIIENNTEIKNNEMLITQLNSFFNIRERRTGKIVRLLDFLKEETVLLDAEAQTCEEAIQIAGNLMANVGAVDQSYIDDMVTNAMTFGSYIALGNGIALPHAQNKNNVHKTCFAVVTLKVPVKFDNEKMIDTIIAFSAKNATDYKEPLIVLMDLIQHSEILQQKFSSSKKFIEFISNI